MKGLMSALPFVGIGAALLALPYIFEPQPKPDTQARQAINTLHAKMESQPVAVGLPPDTHWAGDRVIELPEDGGQWQTVLVLDQSPLSQHLMAQFNSTPQLRDLWSQTKHYTYSANDPWVQRNRAGYPLPLVLLQRPTDLNGSNQWERVYESWGSGLPGTGDQLADSIATMIDNSVRKRPCPQPSPTPGPQPPSPTPVQPMIPLTPDSDPAKPAEDETSKMIYFLVAGISAAGGALLAAKKAY